MKRILLALLLSVFSINISLAQHGHSGKAHHMSSMGKIVFETKKADVEIKAYLNDIETAMKAMAKDKNIKIDMSKVDPNLTHHLSFMIKSGVNTGKIKDAKTEVRLNDKVKEYKLFLMDEHYGSDISLKEKGTYYVTLILDTEKKGIITFNFNIKP